MTKLRLFIPALLLLTSCHFFKSSELQQSVRSVRDAEKTGSEARVEGVHRLLSQRGVEHKIVQFRYDVASRPLVPPVGDLFPLREAPLLWLPARHGVRERTGIVYRDDTDRRNPWWYIDGHARRPVWLPNDSVARQIGFAMRRRIELLRVDEFDRAVDGLLKDRAITETETPREDWNARFLRMHGTEFDAASPVDQAKMQALRS